VTKSLRDTKLIVYWLVKKRLWPPTTPLVRTLCYRKTAVIKRYFRSIPNDMSHRHIPMEWFLVKPCFNQKQVKCDLSWSWVCSSSPQNNINIQRWKSKTWIYISISKSLYSTMIQRKGRLPVASIAVVVRCLCYFCSRFICTKKWSCQEIAFDYCPIKTPTEIWDQKAVLSPQVTIYLHSHEIYIWQASFQIFRRFGCIYTQSKSATTNMEWRE
jgi:hypothetical protein